VTVFSKPKGEPIASTPFADAQVLDVAQRDDGKVLRFDLEHRDIRLGVGAQHLGAEFAPVGQLDGDLAGRPSPRGRWSG
jgi:hypothetical protein